MLLNQIIQDVYIGDNGYIQILRCNFCFLSEFFTFFSGYRHISVRVCIQDNFNLKKPK